MMILTSMPSHVPLPLILISDSNESEKANHEDRMS